MAARETTQPIILFPLLSPCVPCQPAMVEVENPLPAAGGALERSRKAAELGNKWWRPPISSSHEHANALRTVLHSGESLQSLNASIHELTAAANEAQEEAKKLLEQQNSKDFAELKQRAFNDRLMLTERGFLEAEGLKGRKWFKHVLYAPPADYESKLSFFPGIADALSRAAKMARKEGQLGIEHEIWRVARAIEQGASVLRGELT